ncbi:hypothetical protein GWI33_013864 [Rhynchophorus ferrugineus]|uniref:Uncharacterized protein n=1 Tax=Rhynchophorus ferrugineus TaxID=354439 RepID=A0A834I7A9_RHYFE|nr:hypothetical protein GWI33_013864 [Rhynchophorus ferrugineus]
MGLIQLLVSIFHLLPGRSVSSICPTSCDQWLCWPQTAADSTVSLPCPDEKGILETGWAYRYCTIDGTWETKNNSDGRITNYTHFEPCILPQIQDMTNMCNSFGIKACQTIGRVTRIIELVGLSLSFISLSVSLYIFLSYRVLKNNRTKIHINLFLATILQVTFRLVKYIDQELDENRQFLSEEYHLQKASTVLLEYAKTTMFTWMFIEGLYLHNMVTVTVFQEHLHIKFYIWAGWIIPAIMTLIWLGVMIAKNIRRTWFYYYFLPYYWILEGPRFVLILINLIFLLRIIRVLVVKLRQSRSSELEQIRKTVRATILLLPLMGSAHILFLVDYHFKTAWKFGLWSYTTYFLNTFQGTFVAVFYCFLNGEVQTAIRNKYSLRFNLRNSDNSHCVQFTRISNAGTDEANYSTRQSCVTCCNQALQSPEEKEIDLCDIIDKKDGSTNVTVIDTDTSLIPQVQRNGVDVQTVKFQDMIRPNVYMNKTG